MSNYSDDADIESYYPDILELAPSGVTDFNDQHALATERIDVMLKSRGVDPDDITFTDEIKHASWAYVLFLVFSAASAAPGDTYAELAHHWLSEHNRTMASLYWEEDNGDQVITSSEKKSLLARRFERA